MLIKLVICTREQVLACLRLQDQYRAHRRALEKCGSVVRTEREHEGEL